MSGFLVITRDPSELAVFRHTYKTGGWYPDITYDTGKVFLVEGDITDIKHVVESYPIADIVKFKEFLLSKCLPTEPKTIRHLFYASEREYPFTNSGRGKFHLYIGYISSGTFQYNLHNGGIRSRLRDIRYETNIAQLNITFAIMTTMAFNDVMTNNDSCTHVIKRAICAAEHYIDASMYSIALNPEECKAVDTQQPIIDDLLRDLDVHFPVNPTSRTIPADAPCIDHNEHAYIYKIWFVREIMRRYNSSLVTEQDIIRDRIAEMKNKYPIDYAAVSDIKDLRVRLFEYASTTDDKLDDIVADFEYMFKHYDYVIPMPVAVAAVIGDGETDFVKVSSEPIDEVRDYIKYLFPYKNYPFEIIEKYDDCLGVLLIRESKMLHNLLNTTMIGQQTIVQHTMSDEECKKSIANGVKPDVAIANSLWTYVKPNRELAKKIDGMRIAHNEKMQILKPSGEASKSSSAAKSTGKK